jgi:aromatic ring-opening dioxygenase LigB subunit
MIVFAAISPHPPIILPSVGSKEDRDQVKNTIKNLEILGEKLIKAKPDSIIISAPHSDWGFNVPLYFLAKDYKCEIKEILVGLESPKFYFEEGKKAYQNNKYKILDTKYKIALIASGDLSHCLKEDGPYGLHPDGPKFDKDLVDALKKKDIEKILKLDELYPEAGECGLRSFCFLLGILEASGIDYQPEILSYEGPFGVGYLTADLTLLNCSAKGRAPTLRDLTG